MTMTVIKQKLRDYLEIADDEKVKAIYTLVEDEIETSEVEYTDEFKQELERRIAEYKRDPSIGITAEERNRRVQEVLKNGLKK